MKVVNYNLHVDNIDQFLEENKDCDYFHVHHKESFNAENENLITEARKDPDVKTVLKRLANNGFYLYMTKENNISSFVQHKVLDKLWNPIKNKDYFFENDLIYSLENPKILNDVNLLVVFSSISGSMYQSSLHRYFEKNFKSISEYIAPNTAILRIADIGGITGSYYLNNNYIADNESKIQLLISKIARKYEAKKTVLFGVSKGGSGALYHGVLGNYDFVAVDPIVDDEVYLKKHRDLHFVEDIFPVSKVEKFSNVLNGKKYSLINNGCIITSENSPQFSYIEKNIIGHFNRDFSVFINNNPNIKDHPDVAPNSIYIITSLINSTLNGVYIERKIYNCV